MLEQLIDYYEEGNKTRFAKRLGISPQGVSTWLSRGTIDHELIYAKCEGVNADWLLSGEGSMLRSDNASNTISASPTDKSALSDILAVRLMDKLDEKDAENKRLTSELCAMSEELGGLKERIKQLESLNMGTEHHSKETEATEAFIEESSGDYGEGYSSMKLPTTSKSSSAGKV